MLERPEIPLNTNASENDIRAFVTKRKISGGTVSERGRQARDVMLGLAKTCKKLKIPFFDYLGCPPRHSRPRNPPTRNPRQPRPKLKASPRNLPRLPRSCLQRIEKTDPTTFAGRLQAGPTPADPAEPRSAI